MSQKNHTSPDFRSAALFFLLFATGNAGAFSLGDLVLESRLGQPLRAYIPVTNSGPNQIDTTCLHPQKSTDGDPLPRLAKVRLELKYANGQPQIVVNSEGSANDVAFLLGVQIGCGYNLDRDYVVLLDPPEITPTGMPAINPVAEKTPATAGPIADGRGAARRAEHGARVWEVREGESLQTLAEQRYPGNLLMQNRMIAATMLENLAAFPDGTVHPVTPGTRLRLPDPKKIATTHLSRFQAAIRHALSKAGGAEEVVASSRPVYRIQVSGGKQTEAKRGDSMESDKQRLQMEGDDSSAALLSLQRRIEEAESHLEQLKVLEREMDKKLATARIAATRAIAPVPAPASDNLVSGQAGLIGGTGIAAGLIAALFLRRRKGRNGGKASGTLRELTSKDFL